MQKHRILILTSSTGGGHDMRADALSEWLETLEADKVVVERWQVLEESSLLDRFGVQLYNRIQRDCPWAHHFYFNFLEYLGLHRRLLGIRGKRKWRARARAFRPTVVVSTHAHLNHGYFRLLAEALAPEAPRCLTYCGELHDGYGFSRHWVNPKADGFIAAVPASANAARLGGMPKDRIHTGGFLLKPSFYNHETEPPTIEDLVGAPLKRPIVLLGTGANGANNHLRILRQLADLEAPVVFLALCGHDQRSYVTLQSLNIAPHRVVPLAYQSKMADLLRAVDLAFIRPGSGTTSECIQCQCPILFNGIGGVMPQERITLRGIHNIGVKPVVVRSPRAFGATLAGLLNHQSGQTLRQQSNCFRAFQSDKQPEAIVRKILA